jgi:glycerophosphoryl diester phosphodiesterase
VPKETARFQILTPQFVAAAHERGLAMQPWTINEEADLKRILALGVDGINANNPNRLLDLLPS